MITGTGTCPNDAPWPHQTKPGSKPLIGPPPAKSSAAPRNTDMPPSVTTKGGTFSRVIASPLQEAADQADGDRRERGEIPGDSCIASCPSPTVKRFDRPPFDTAAATSPAMASSDPTERSMPAVRITNVMPIASRP